MAKRRDKKAERVKQIFELANGENRTQWEYVNQKGFDFANDNQLTESERIALEEQGMPTFTINRIMPVVEMLNFYATANKPRWQAVGAEGSDVDVAAVFSDLADYIWDLSDGSSLYANAVNDAVCKGIGYLQIAVDPDADQGLGDVVIKQPEPFDIFVDPKSRDMLFRDAGFVLIRKILPKEHLKSQFPQHISKINKARYKGKHDNGEIINLKEPYVLPVLWSVHIHLTALLPYPNRVQDDESIIYKSNKTEKYRKSLSEGEFIDQEDRQL